MSHSPKLGPLVKLINIKFNHYDIAIPTQIYRCTQGKSCR